MPGTSPCGIGGSQNPGGPCTGTYNPQEASQAGAHAFDGVQTSSVIAGLLAAGAMLAALIFVRFMVGRVASFFDERRERREAEVAAAERHRKSFERGFDFAEFGQKLHEAGGGDDDEAEDDSEDDSELDDSLEYKPERIA